jgi:hypothetical protein
MKVREGEEGAKEIPPGINCLHLKIFIRAPALPEKIHCASASPSSACHSK